MDGNGSAVSCLKGFMKIILQLEVMIKSDMSQTLEFSVISPIFLSVFSLSLSPHLQLNLCVRVCVSVVPSQHR